MTHITGPGARIIADGTYVLSDSCDGAWDFIFLDAERSLYVDWWPSLQRVLTVERCS